DFLPSEARPSGLAFAGRGGIAAALSSAGPRGWGGAGRWRAHALPVLLAILLFFLTVVPVLTIVVSSFRPSGLPLSDGWTVEHFATVWSNGYTYRLLGNTLIFAAGSTAFGIAL